MKVLYDVNVDEILHLRKFNFEEHNQGHTSYYTNITIEVDEYNSTYVRDWYLKTLQQTNGKLHYPSEYKRDLYITDLKDKQIKLLNCFIKSVKDNDTFLTIELYCDHYIIGDSTTFPELKSLYRNAVLSVLGI